MTRLRIAPFALTACLLASTASAQLSVVVRDISPDQSNNSDPDGASGGRINNVATEATRRASTRPASSEGFSEARTAA